MYLKFYVVYYPYRPSLYTYARFYIIKDFIARASAFNPPLGHIIKIMLSAD